MVKISPKINTTHTTVCDLKEKNLNKKHLN